MNQQIIDKAKVVAAETLKRNAQTVDQNAQFPAESFRAFKAAGLLGLMFPRAYGGEEIDLLTFAEVMEIVGGACASSGMCFLMHNIACINIDKGSSPAQKEELLKRFFADPVIATQAISEAGTGSHFYVPELETKIDGDSVRLNGKKKFCTSGGHADWYVIYAKASANHQGANFILLEKGTPGLAFDGQWRGMGLRGNSSIALTFDNVRVPRSRLLGVEEGKAVDVLFGPNCATFILGQAALNVGIAQHALDAAVTHAKTRNHASAGPALSNHQAIRFYLAEMLAAVETARLKVQDTARQVMDGHANATRSLFVTKFVASEASRRVTDLALQILGGRGYGGEGPVERLFRDARAGALMGPTSELMMDWTGKLLTDMPLL